MSATVGDRIRLHATTADAPDRVGTVVAVLGDDAGPPYRVRFETGEETIVSPGPEAVIEPPSAAERLEQVGERIVEKAGEVASAVGEAGTAAAGGAVRAVADAADAVARRLGS